MDANEDDKDIQLQRASSVLIPRFETALKPFLYKSLPSGKSRIRRWVRERDLIRLITLLEPFQEWPQLLDPHLEKFLPLLSDTLVGYLRLPPRLSQHNTSRQLVPLSEAICKILYTFCKIRGEKVIVRFFDADTKNLELLLSAIEAAGTSSKQEITSDDNASRSWSWEERYICLLWLSHLLLAPFDLATISSDDAEHSRVYPVVSGLSLPPNLPGITARVVPLAIKYLDSPGKERDAAKVLLVRISMRRDMQELGLLRALVPWATDCLQTSSPDVANPAYFIIGILSFLGGVLISSITTSDMDPFLSQIFRVIQNISEDENAAFKTVHSSAIARKAVIKVLRSMTVIVLRGGIQQDSLQNVDVTEVVEYTIGHLLESLSHNDTPVRLAASKALSIITLKLAPEMASQVVDAVLESLNQNVLWQKNPLDPDGPRTRDLSAVNPLEWHGLMLTLSHLLYRRSPPPSSLPDIIHALLIGLTFERRSTSGSSVGTNVRDAACFGVWSLARRYTTAELLSIKSNTISAASHHDQTSSVLQILAIELVVSACLDPVGNIRRGASASLQELIGRHPDTIVEGIKVVQIVDYHAVALRSRAMVEVSSNAALLSNFYEDALITALLSWRGIGDGDAASRRSAALAIRTLAGGFRKRLSTEESLRKTSELVARINSQIKLLKTREIDQRHGLLLSMAAAVAAFAETVETIPTIEVTQHPSVTLSLIEPILKDVRLAIQDSKISVYRRPEAVIEATSRIIAASCALMRIASFMKTISHKDLGKKDLQALIHQPSRIEEGKTLEVQSLLDALDVVNPGQNPESQAILELGEEMVRTWLAQKDIEVIAAATDAAVSLALTTSSKERKMLIDTWIDGVLQGDGRDGQAIGFLFALATVFPLAAEDQQENICRVILEQWKGAKEIESKVALMQFLTRGPIVKTHAATFIDMIDGGLDDYTTDARGDIGSLVRLEALKAAKSAFLSIPWLSIEQGPKDQWVGSWFTDRDIFTPLLGRILRLAAEKLDKVRTEAQQTLAIVVRDDIQRAHFEQCLVSSYEYFRWLLDLQTRDWLSLPLFEYEPRHWKTYLFEGYVSSADTGSEGLIRASRAALVDFCEQVGEADEISDHQRTDEESARNIVCDTLFQVAKKHINNDRVLIPAMETMSFLFDAGVMQRSNIQWRSLYLLIQKAHYKSGNVRKLEAAVKLYGGLLDVYPEAIQKLVGMLLHPFPNIRNQVADTLFVTKGVGKGVNWVRARKDEIAELKGKLNIT